MIASLLLAAACAQPPEWFSHPFEGTACPQVFRVHGGADTDTALDVLFVPSGFREEELDVFRCGVALTVEAMLSRPPFDRYGCSINVWRIDLATEHPWEDAPTCGGQTCMRTPPLWTPEQQKQQCGSLPPEKLGVPIGKPDADACLGFGLHVQGCPPGSTSCRVMWPDILGLRRIWRLAACAPGADVVVVVVNSGEWAGGGMDDMVPPLVVTTLDGISAERTRARLLTHELGHALGLLDEYSQGYPESGAAPTYHANRNVAKAGATPPWSSVCDPPGCATVASCPTPADPSDPPSVGLWEGAFYQSCGYYRGSQTCAMRDPEQDFCPACVSYLSGLFEAMGMKACSGK